MDDSLGWRTHDGEGLLEELKELNLVRVERVARVADGVRRGECRHSADHRGDEAEFPELGLKGVRCGVLAEENGACVGESVERF